jgi:hypothetical protein
MREDLEKARSDTAAKLAKIDGGFKPNQTMLGGKPTAKVFVPVAEYPTYVSAAPFLFSFLSLSFYLFSPWHGMIWHESNHHLLLPTNQPTHLSHDIRYNFIGQIIGPRGNTQRKLEGDTGCKISIRGKGSVKEGSRGRNTKNVEAAEAEDLHVLITGPSRENVDMAVKIVEGLLLVRDDEDNSHKQSQLRELALINGTLREDEFCLICGEKGHRQYVFCSMSFLPSFLLLPLSSFSRCL